MGRSSPEPPSEPTNQNTWSLSTSHQTTQHVPPPYFPPGFSSSSKPAEAPTTPWLRRRVDSNTPQPSQKWSVTAPPKCTTRSSKGHVEKSSQTQKKKNTRLGGLKIAGNNTASTTAPPHW